MKKNEGGDSWRIREKEMIVD